MALPAKEFKISKKPMSDYIVKSLTDDSQTYAVHIGNHGSTEHAFMFLHEGTSTKSSKTIVGSVRRIPEHGTFEVVCNGFQDMEDVGALTVLKRSAPRNAEMEIGMSDGKPRELAWRPNLRPGQSCKLMDMMGSETVLAVYDENAVMGRGGTLTLNVDWGLDFERSVILSVINMTEKMSVWGKTFQARGCDVPMSKAPFYGVGTGAVGGMGFFAVGGAGGGGGGGDGGGGGC